MQSTLGVRICEAMEQRNLSKLYAVAVALNVTESAVSRWRKSGRLTVENTIALCELLDVSSDWLLLGRGTMDMHRGTQPMRAQQVRISLASLPEAAVVHLEHFLAAIESHRA
ncbi:helix-turn-helix domain-containing protein [Pseudomonas sp. PDM04]|jgi:transcriptional regulator with XRE-family HTH domain|uniref:helix-turn-helix domain-containing protein n=1 Tax=Pseudomonas sp. PDM04 TaxID=2769296 RepID=UPI00177ED757|nr:helix-turn-helix transcriptional regulator [Pseudomonas sp. PDM04]MBD9442859.1 helix-turn-helix transcriptional regulator [Pseudomonas sp. PDM04]